jgi:hypothetical protein
VRASHLLTTLLATCACAPAITPAVRPARLSASFTPERLGYGASVSLDVRTPATTGRVPAPLTEVTVRYPAGLGIELSGLGIDTCSGTRLEARGPKGCPADSLMGTGSALAEMRIGPTIVREHAPITIVRAPEREGHLAMFFYAQGKQPVIVRLVFTGVLLPASPPFGGAIKIAIPPIEGLPGTYVAIVQLHLVLGPPQLIYYERVHSHTIAYRPKRIRLPGRCPHGGFPFSATLAFLDGGRVSLPTAVPCQAR